MHSPFADVLHTNYIPTDAEIAQIPLISLPRRLPRDIVEELFLACLPDDKNAAIDTTEAPLILGHICSAWRVVSLTTPRLWASLHVPFAFVAAECDRTHILAEWLGRSGSRPLSLSVEGDDDPDLDELDVSFTQAYVDSALGVLLRNSHRWEHLQLTRISPSMSKLLFGVHAPMLRSIDIDGSVELIISDGGEDDSDEDVGSADSMRMKLLRSTSLRGLFLPHFDSRIWQLPLHWEAITHLDFGRADRFNGGSAISLFDAYKVLVHCPRLKYLQFDPIDSPPSEWEPFPRPSLPYLHTLFVGSVDENYKAALPDVEPFWDEIPPMPQLEKFSLGQAGFPTRQHLDSIIRKMPRLKWLATIAPRDAQGLGFLNLLPSVTYIKFRAHGADLRVALTGPWRSVFYLLTPSMRVHGQDRLRSALEELVIASCGIVSPSSVRNFIDGHIQAQTSLHRLTVDFRDEDQEPIMSDEEKAAAKAAGLNVEFTFPPTDKRASGTTGRRVFSFV
ncbi:hypothetical protein C8F01DRAFT_1371843 [Mycena amicta]|nr:hypothetical protein C8F01DRAFT_1371843 [Mycena amicta]